MSKIRLVKERKNSEKEFDQDLRGLGNTSLLKNEYPWVYLALECQPNAIKDTKEIFNFEIKTPKSKGVNVIYLKCRTMNHKEKTLNLFFAAISILKSDPNASLLIGQISALKESLSSRNTLETDETESNDFKLWDRVPGRISTSESINIYLRHAGIELESCSSDWSNIEKVLFDLESKESAQVGKSKLSKIS